MRFCVGWKRGLSMFSNPRWLFHPDTGNQVGNKLISNPQKSEKTNTNVETKFVFKVFQTSLRYFSKSVGTNKWLLPICSQSFTSQHKHMYGGWVSALQANSVLPQSSFLNSMSRMRKSGGCAVGLDSTSTMHGCQVQTATHDEGVPSGAGMKCWKGVAHCLNSRRGERRALADVESLKPFLIIPAFPGFPHCCRLVLH